MHTIMLHVHVQAVIRHTLQVPKKNILLSLIQTVINTPFPHHHAQNIGMFKTSSGLRFCLTFAIVTF